MGVLTLHDADGYLSFDPTECERIGAAFAANYRKAVPFPNIVIDDFLDAKILRKVAGSFPPTEGKTYFNRDQERLKYQFQPYEMPNGMVRNLLAEFNSGAFLGFLREMTGIEGLIADPHFAGGGLHETKRGGHLSVHADFDIHRQLKIIRRLNLIVYLNDDWEESYGGALELWNRNMSAREHQIFPVLGRAVIFDTSSTSYHGHPDPLTCPPDRSRKSIATYYYTAAPEGVDVTARRTTTHRVRPGSADRPDRQTILLHFIKDWMPPKFYRGLRRMRRSDTRAK